MAKPEEREILVRAYRMVAKFQRRRFIRLMARYEIPLGPLFSEGTTDSFDQHLYPKKLVEIQPGESFDAWVETLSPFR